MENISVVGLGKLGLCFALTLEKAGYNVMGADIYQKYVDSVNDKTLNSSEPGVNEQLSKAVNLLATTDLKQTVEHSDLLFVIVATPSLPNGRYDHSQVDGVIQKLKTFGRQPTQKHFVVCCTVMPGYCDSIKQELSEYNYTVSYNPEFIAQGTILRDQAQPDMVLIGEATKEMGDRIQSVYEAHTLNSPKFARMSPVEAEITKLSLNCFLTTKIAYANMVGDIVKSVGGNPDTVLQAIGSDSRIGNKYLRYGYGYGGPCCEFSQLVQTDKGLKQIGNIQVGDKVLTHKGRYRTVTKTYERQYNGDMFKFKTNNTNAVSLTPGHPVFVQRELFVPVEELYEQYLSFLVLLPKCINETEIKYSTVTQMTINQYEGLVYNLEVAEDESYALESCVVHNCFPRDNRALGIFAEDISMPAKISNATDLSNDLHLSQQVKFFSKEHPNKETPVEFSVVSYKPESTMLTESQQLKFAVALAKEGYKVVLTERQEVVSEVKATYGDLFEYKVRD
jgi:UDPglucose 6-dehydrogenase